MKHAWQGEQRHYRIDKIEDIVVLEEERLPGLEYFLEKFMKEYRMMFGMFGGEEEKVTILCKKEKIGILIDRFGYDIPILKHGNMLKTVV